MLRLCLHLCTRRTHDLTSAVDLTSPVTPEVSKLGIVA